MKISENRKFSCIKVFEVAESNGGAYFALKYSFGELKEGTRDWKPKIGPDLRLKAKMKPALNIPALSEKREKGTRI